jgi:SAM-dependent methyltransferase
MLAAARLSQGEHVLDVGSGDGDMALLAKEAVGAPGFVLATDVDSARMARLAACLQTSPHSKGIALMESAAEHLSLEPGSFDAAMARNCLMYFQDLPTALGRIRSALRTGGRFVASIYGPLAREPFHAIPIAAVARRHPMPEQAPEYVQAFRLGVDATQRALADAGFAGIRSQIVATARTYPSHATALELLRASRSLNELLSVLPASERADAWKEIAEGFRAYEAGGAVKLPGEQVVISGVA